MAKESAGVVITRSMYEAIEPLSDEERLAMYDAIVGYGIKKKLPTLTGYLKAIFAVMKPNIDSSQNRYKASRENGAKGGAPKGNQNARKKQPENNQTINQTINQTNNQDIDINKNNNSNSNSSDGQTWETEKLKEMYYKERRMLNPEKPVSWRDGPTYFPDLAEV